MLCIKTAAMIWVYWAYEAYKGTQTGNAQAISLVADKACQLG